MNKLYDLIIVGGGAAGLTASIYAVRAGADFTLINMGASMGSQIAQTSDVDNYTGLMGINGFDLVQKFYEHAKSLNVNMTDDEVLSIEKNNDIFTIKGRNGSYDAKSLIYAFGAKHRELGVKGENEFLGNGVGYCAVCDGFFYKNKTAVVVGGGNTALTDAIFLSKFCNKVILVHRSDKLKADKILTDKFYELPNTEVMFNKQIKEIVGDKTVSSVVLSDGNVINTDGVFIAVGIKPLSETVKCLVKTDDYGYIVANEDCKTSVEGFFAAGDVRTKKLRQIITACADGANAFDSAAEYLNSKK